MERPVGNQRSHRPEPTRSRRSRRSHTVTLNRSAAAAAVFLLASVAVAVALLSSLSAPSSQPATPFPPVASPAIRPAATGASDPTPVPAPSPTPGPLRVSVIVLEPNYTVQPGDTLGALARRAGITTEGLASLNRLSNSDRLSVGQRLIVPEP